MKRKILFIVSSLFTISALCQGLECKTEAKIDLVQSQYGLSGKGVLTIMMDRGIDYRHPDFIDADGNTRIAYIYDLYDNTGANDPDNPFGVGTIYDSTEINASLLSGDEPLSNDLFGHGTATTGIMSGNGSAVSPAEKFRGVAHEAKIISIIVTKDYVPPFGNSAGQQGQYNPTLLTYAFQFAEQKISELNMPSVTLLNIGSIGEPTDGSIPLCDIITDYVAKGNTFVCGVGDDGGQINHDIEILEEDIDTEIFLQKEEVGNLRFVGWYSEDDRFTLTIQTPDGQIVGPFDPPVGPSDIKNNFLDEMNIYHRGADVDFSNSTSNLRQLLIDFTGEIGVYRMILTPTVVNSNGKLHAMLNPSRFHNENLFLTYEELGGNINAYSACPDVISPGDYVATNNWTDVNGVPRMKVGQGEPGELWLGSSIGPTMDDRLGIDLASPGEVAWSAYGEGSYYSSFAFNVLEGSNGYYGLQTAVSASAPLLAGVIALMLEANPALTPAEIKTILQETAREDSFTGLTPNERWGHGKLDALEAVNEAYLSVNNEQEEGLISLVRIQPNPAVDYIEIECGNLGGEEIQVSLFSVEGRFLADYHVLDGQKLYIGDLTQGIYLVRIKSPNSILTKVLLKK